MPTVRFENDMVEVEIEPGQALSLAAQEAEASLPFGCRAGTCGACALTVDEGADGIDPAGFVEQDTLVVCGEDGPGRRLGCQIILRDADVSVSW